MMHRIVVWLLQLLGFDPRNVFRYYDGKKYINADPIVLVRRMWSVNLYQYDVPGMNEGPETPFDSVKARDLIATGDSDKVQKGYSIVSRAARYIFNVKSLEEGGLTEVECDELLDRFENYLGDLKKSINLMPTSVTSTEETEENSTNSSLDSGSTSIEKNYAMPDVSGLV